MNTVIHALLLLIYVIGISLGILICLLSFCYWTDEDQTSEDPPKPPNLPDRYVQARKAVGSLRFDTVWQRYEEWLAEQDLTVDDVYHPERKDEE